MATKNGERFLHEQIDSILGQLDEDDELVISDDHSSDQTVAIVESYRDPRIRLLKHSTAIGITRNFEAALESSRGDVIFFADQDDLWLPQKKMIMLDHLAKFDLVISDCLIVDETLRTAHRSFFSVNGSRKGLVKNLLKNSYMGCCMAFNRKLLLRALPFPDDIPMYDQWIGMIGELYFKVKFVHEPLVYYRRHGMTATSSGEASSLPFRKKLSGRYYIIKNIFLHKYAR